MLSLSQSRVVEVRLLGLPPKRLSDHPVRALGARSPASGGLPNGRLPDRATADWAMAAVADARIVAPMGAPIDERTSQFHCSAALTKCCEKRIGFRSLSLSIPNSGCFLANHTEVYNEEGCNPNNCHCPNHNACNRTCRETFFLLFGTSLRFPIALAGRIAGRLQYIQDLARDGPAVVIDDTFVFHCLSARVRNKAALSCRRAFKLDTVLHLLIDGDITLFLRG
jgi:hypothetical protein